MIKVLDRYFYLEEHQLTSIYDRQNSHTVPVATCRERWHAVRIVEALNAR